MTGFVLFANRRKGYFADAIAKDGKGLEMGTQSGGNRSNNRRAAPIWLAASASALTIAAGLAISTSSVMAQQKTARTTAADTSALAFNIPAQSLNTAVLAFADRAGLQVFFDAERLKGLRSSGVQGTYSREQAIGQLLLGTGVSYRFTGATTVSLVMASTGDSAENADGFTTLQAITISSLGAVGGVVSTPIINHPEVAIVGVNRIIERPMFREGQVVARKLMNLSSSFDHRIVDGMDAAEFVQAIRTRLETPALLFVE